MTAAPVPTIDISLFEAGRLPDPQWAALDAACRDHGFFLLTGHGMSAELDNMWAASEAFFAQPTVVKRQVMRDAMNPLGYYDQELTKRKRDLKEVFDFKAGGHMSSRVERQTRWPEVPALRAKADFRRALTAYFAASTELARNTMAMVFAACGMSPEMVARRMVEAFGEATDATHTSSARLNYYPAGDPLPEDERADVTALGDMALHHHTDPGSVTLLVQDTTGGLQALSRHDGWIDVPPTPGTIVVNLGDVVQVWTNDVYRAAVHRVLPISSPQGRYSTPFFFQPRFDAVIEPWGEGQPVYSAFSWRDFIRGRVTDNYSDPGEDDIQIARYRVAG